MTPPPRKSAPPTFPVAPVRHGLPALAGFALALLAAWAPAFSRPPQADPNTVDSSSPAGKVLCGYQGWFNCAGDGADLGWKHWSRDRRAPKPGTATFDLWPEVAELGPDERFPTEFRLADGRPAELFSAYRQPTVHRHFRWMREYGLDGVWLQRFIAGLNHPPLLRHNDAVLAHCQSGARAFGRVYAVEYDLSGSPAGGLARVAADWKQIRARFRLDDDPRYLRHQGKLLVGVWGIGFAGADRKYSLAESRELIETLARDNVAILVGVPNAWRILQRDAVADPALHDLIARAHIVCPWTVGRFRTEDQVAQQAERFWKPDRAWCQARGLEYMPVVFPGFSWANLKNAKLNEIPRRGGQFLWTQYRQAQLAGATMIFQAMFDEVDEGTAIFKCGQSVPTEGQFLDFEGLPSDHYLKLVGHATRMLRQNEALPARLPDLKAPPTPAASPPRPGNAQDL